MDRETQLKQYHEYLKGILKERKPEAQDIRDAVAAADGTSLILDEIIIQTETLWGIDPGELADLYEKRDAAQKEAKEKQRRADIKTAFTKIQETITSLTNIIDTAPINEIDTAFTAFYRETAQLAAAAAPVNRFPTWADYEAAWQKDNDHDFSPPLFNHLPFPDGTVSYIGARTGRGKTTAMVNIGIEALFTPKDLDKPRRVLFISLEESHKQILRRFSLCLAYGNADQKERQELLSVTNPYTDKKDPKNAYKNWKRGRDIGGNGAKTFIKAIIEVENAIKDKVTAGELVFFDGIGASLHEILAAIQGRKRGDIVLLDYIQKIPAMGKTYSGNPDLERIRDGSQRLIEAAIGAECVIIAGAQFNRDSAKGQKSDDEFTDADFRGCGDLEQDGHNLIGIGRSADKTKTYYNILKSREGEITDKHYTLHFAGGYSFMEYEGNEITTKQHTKPQKSKNSTNTDKGTGINFDWSKV